VLRLSNLADYGVVVMTAAARTAERSGLSSTVEISEQTGIPVPTVAKVTGLLARANLLVSQRGSAGGFTLARPADTISLADIVEAIDGPIALTHCADGGHDCTLHGHCAVKPHWDPVNRAVKAALSDVSLAALAPATQKAFA
jgi:FeS assembly SUF system regulator